MKQVIMNNIKRQSLKSEIKETNGLFLRQYNKMSLLKNTINPQFKSMT